MSHVQKLSWKRSSAGFSRVEEIFLLKRRTIERENGLGEMLVPRRALPLRIGQKPRYDTRTSQFKRPFFPVPSHQELGIITVRHVLHTIGDLSLTWALGTITGRGVDYRNKYQLLRVKNQRTHRFGKL